MRFHKLESTQENKQTFGHFFKGSIIKLVFGGSSQMDYKLWNDILDGKCINDVVIITEAYEMIVGYLTIIILHFLTENPLKKSLHLGRPEQNDWKNYDFDFTPYLMHGDAWTLIIIIN